MYFDSFEEYPSGCFTDSAFLLIAIRRVTELRSLYLCSHFRMGLPSQSGAKAVNNDTVAKVYQGLVAI